MRLERLDNAKITTPMTGHAVRFDGGGWTNGGGFVGTVTISEAATSAAVSLTTTQSDTSYRVLVVPQSTTGTPAVGSNRVLSISSKTTTGFTLNIEAAPGGGNGVTFVWEVVR